MGQLDQFAKETFALETRRVTGGAVEWQLPPELGMSEVRLDGLLRVVDPIPLSTLAAPWSSVGQSDELVLEIKMVGDHLDLLSFDRASLRRLARLVRRREDQERPFDGEVPLWYVASHVPEVIKRRRPIVEIAPGCYRIGPEWLACLWIAANDLPLADELVPFLIARSGRQLDKFLQWVRTRRSIPWLVRVLKCLPMSTAAYDDMWDLAFPETDDPEFLARERKLALKLVDSIPGLRADIMEEGQLRQARANLQRIFMVRGLPLSPKEEALIDDCTDLSTLERWHDQAVVATSASEALQ